MAERLQAGLVRVETWIAGLALVLLAGITLLQIVARNLFGTGFPALESLARVLLFYVTFLGAALAVAADRHIKVDLLAHGLPGPWRDRLHRPLHVLGAAVCALSCWAAGRYWYDAWSFAPESGRWLVLAELILPVGFALLAVHFVLRALLGPANPRNDSS